MRNTWEDDEDEADDDEDDDDEEVDEYEHEHEDYEEDKDEYEDEGYDEHTKGSCLNLTSGSPRAHLGHNYDPSMTQV